MYIFIALSLSLARALRTVVWWPGECTLQISIEDQCLALTYKGIAVDAPRTFRSYNSPYSLVCFWKLSTSKGTSFRSIEFQSCEEIISFHQQAFGTASENRVQCGLWGAGEEPDAAPKVPKESDKHLHGVKRTGIGGKRGVSVTLGIRKYFPSKEQLGLGSKGRT